ncbi:ribosomal-protein-alanine acetyltransferase [Candidatus Protochlamydia naegleriophila]|uniref:Ribosomal-protein-alanine acetyltransferase n=1 Tax=Candidatus Protochlamydia naegleriophila TaxID=389348 RepID=A0A0U5JDR9_9BACT|nr:GNAT family N-acetyltransferase [Candidatus Protochlamydia naegleriophila]CUI16754.1 ribosomal-protein-alanine acetyltransferase [Candidatus Protochlamydia naegleriophila]
MREHSHFSDSLILKTERLLLKTPQLSHAEALVDFEKRNREFLKPYMATTGEDLFSVYEWEKRLEKWQVEQQHSQSMRLLFFLKGSAHRDLVIGSCHFTQCFRGAFHACYLGYKIDQSHQGYGFMFEGLQHAISYLFDDLNFHRIMANYLPTNLRSEQLLKRLGFMVEGYAKNYLMIDGRWQDHVLTSLTNAHWQEEPHEPI